MSRARTYILPVASTMNIINFDADTPNDAGVVPFANMDNINSLGWGQYSNLSGSITSSSYFLGKGMFKLYLESDEDLTSSTITIVGKDILGNIISETLAGPDDETVVTTAKQYACVDSVSVSTAYSNLGVSNTNNWTSSLFMPDVERGFFNMGISFASPPDAEDPNASFQLYGTLDEVFPTLPFPYSSAPNAVVQPNLTLSDLTKFQLLPSTPNTFQNTAPANFFTTNPYTAFWVVSNPTVTPDDQCEGLVITFLQQGVV